MLVCTLMEGRWTQTILARDSPETPLRFTATAQHRSSDHTYSQPQWCFIGVMWSNNPRHALTTREDKLVGTHLQESQPEVRAKWDFPAGFAVDPSPQRCAGRVAEELEEGHEQPVLALEDFDDKVLLQRRVKNTQAGAGPRSTLGDPDNAFSAFIKQNCCMYMRAATENQRTDPKSTSPSPRYFALKRVNSGTKHTHTQGCAVHVSAHGYTPILYTCM